MNFLKKPFQFGSLTLANNIFYAPLAGCSDLPFRKMALRFQRPGLFFSEMVKMDALVRHDAKTYQLLDFTPDMHPIGAQLCGSKVSLAKESARILEDLGFDAIDLNCGCPVDKVTKDGSGSGLLKTPERIGEILAEIKSAVRVPVSLKIRAGWDERSIIAPQITKIAEDAGAVAITIHGRTREQAYRGPSNWEYIRDAKSAAKNILVIGNGDLFEASDALEMFEKTGCDGVLVARGTLGNPWIAEDILDFLENREAQTRGIECLKETLFAHFEEILKYRAEKQALLDFRRVGCWYLKNCVGIKALRKEINSAESIDQVFSFLKAFSWEEVSRDPECKAALQDSCS